MKKFILTAVAAGALAVGGAASAQDLGSVLSGILGYGQPTYQTYPGYPNYNRGIPAVVAGTQPYDTQPYGTYGANVYGNNTYGGTSYGSQVYVDQYGRQVMIDQYGRHVLVQQPNTGTYGITGYDQWGRPIYGTTYGGTTYGGTTYGSSTYGYSGRAWDRDGDGVANAQDRWPDDRRYR